MQKNQKEWLSHFESTIFGNLPFDFTEKAVELFHFQYKNNVVYKKYCDLISCDIKSVTTLQQIPFLPISFFKTHPITSGKFKVSVIFSSSGTTGSAKSLHLVKDLSLYELSFRKAFELFYGNIEDYCILGLLPSYLERSGSSLIYMVNDLIKKSQHTDSGFFLDNQQELAQLLEKLGHSKQKTLLMGVSFGLLDFVEQYSTTKNPELIVMETGGMKGRRREMIREELHEVLSTGFQTKNIHSEYGMTELLSQAYSKGHGKFTTPPWMRTLIRKQDDPYQYEKKGTTGAINVIDLANIHSCAFIQTDDLGRQSANDEFEVLGRFDVSDVRGCNLMVV